MIFCYAWSNLLIINMVNVKLNQYPNEKADLIIKSSPTIEMSLVQTISKMNIFEHIYFDDYVSFRPQKKKKKKMGFWELRKKYNNHFLRFINSLGETVYDRVLIAGYWNDTLYILQQLIKRGDKFSIEFVEEGEISYEESWKMYRAYIGTNRRLKYFHKINTFSTRRRCDKLFSGNIYLYLPERQEQPEFKPIEIPKLKEENLAYQVLQALYEDLPECQKIYYAKRKVIFFGNYLMPTFYEDTYRNVYGLINTILQHISNTQLIIKPHISQTEHRLNFAKEYASKQIYVDREVYIFEALFCGMDFSNKILIAKTSSLLMHPVSMFDEEPYIFLLYKLYPWYKNYGDEVADRYTEALRRMYREPEKVYAPNSVLDFRVRLSEVYSKIF